MDITISLTEKQFEKITDFLKMFSININAPAVTVPPAAPAAPVMPKKYLPRDLTTTEKVLKVLEKLWKKDIFVSYSDVMRQGHFTAAELKPALCELKARKKCTFFECAEPATGRWPALYIGQPVSTEDQFAEEIEKKSKSAPVRHKIPCWLIHQETGECKYFSCMNEAWRFLGIGRGDFRPASKHVKGYVYKGWKFCFPEEAYNEE